MIGTKPYPPAKSTSRSSLRERNGGLFSSSAESRPRTDSDLTRDIEPVRILGRIRPLDLDNRTVAPLHPLDTLSRVNTGWAWAAQSFYPGFCLTFVRDGDPATVAELLGGGPPRLLTAEEADRVFPLALPGSLLHCGTIPGWAFCYEDRAPIGFQPALLQRLSADSDVVQVVKGGDGMNIARRVVDGRQTEEFEPGSAFVNRGSEPTVLLATVERVLRDHPETSGLVAALHAISEHVGGAIPRDVLDGPLLTTISTRTAADVTTPASPAPHGLGRLLATFTAPGQPVVNRGRPPSDLR